MDLLGLYRADGFEPRRVGSEYYGPCPDCGGEDRFRIWPNEGNWPKQGRWWCRQCGLKGDLPGYLMTFKGMRYPEACQQLDIELERPITRPRQVLAIPKWQPKESSLPPVKWRSHASEVVSWCEKQLWSGTGKKIRSYLHDRGLSNKSIKDARLGFNPKERFLSREKWGLEPKLNDKGNPSKLWFPAGLVIPVFRGRYLTRIKMRQNNPKDRTKKYIQIAGGDAGRYMVLGRSRVCWVVVESELDALLLYQEVKDLGVGIMATGSVSYRPDFNADRSLKKCRLILNALDTDEAGAKEAWGWWRSNYKHSRRWPIPKHKDPTEAHQDGFDLRLWVDVGLERFEGMMRNAQESNEKSIRQNH